MKHPVLALKTIFWLLSKGFFEACQPEFKSTFFMKGGFEIRIAFWNKGVAMKMKLNDLVSWYSVSKLNRPHSQCGNPWIFLPLRFYVKSFLADYPKASNRLHVKSEKRCFSNIVDSVEGSWFFYHLDFTWNQFWGSI